MRISPLHKTRKTADFGRIVFKKHPGLHGNKLKTGWLTTANCDGFIHYNGYLCMVLIDKRNSSKTCRFRHWIEQAKLLMLVISFLKISSGYMEVDWKQNDWQKPFSVESLKYNDYLWMALIIKRNLILTCGFHHWIEQTKLLFLVTKFSKINERKGVICCREVAD